MAFQPEDFDDLVRYLDEHPDLRDQLRRRILSDEFLRLPMVVQELAEGFGRLEAAVTALTASQQRTDERLERLEAAIVALTAAQQRTDERLERLEAAIVALTAAQQRTDERLERLEAAIVALTAAQQRTDERLERLEAAIIALTAAQDRTDAAIVALTAAQQRTEERVDRLAVAQEKTDATLSKLVTTVEGLTGVLTETRFRERVSSYYGTVLRRPRSVPVDELELIDRAMETGLLTASDFAELLRLDVVVRGKDKRSPELPDTLFALEVSATVDTEDVVRAVRRAEILARAGYRAFPSVGGSAITNRALALAEGASAVVVLHEAS